MARRKKRAEEEHTGGEEHTDKPSKPDKSGIEPGGDGMGGPAEKTEGTAQAASVAGGAHGQAVGLPRPVTGAEGEEGGEAAEREREEREEREEHTEGGEE